MQTKPMRVTFAALFTFVATGLGAQARTTVATDSTRLQGTWRMASGSADGQPMPPASLSAMQRQLVGNTLTVTMSGQVYFKATIQLDPTHSPKTIDYKMTDGPTAGAVQHGMYQFSGDTVRFIMSAPGAARPSDWTSKEGDGRTLSTWVKVRP